MTQPQRSLEIEITFDADVATVLPDWSVLPGVHEVVGPQIRHLDALYLDTASGTLARAGVAIRRRTGGPDEGWHVKGPIVDGGRVELQWPITTGIDIPDAVRQAAAEWTDEPLVPLARIRNERHACELRDAGGRVVAEMVDDHVESEDLREAVTRAWREWEVELGPAAPEDRAWRDEFFAAATRVAYEAGARAASSASKLARALGH